MSFRTDHSPLLPWKAHPETKESLDWAPLDVIDLATFDTSKEDLARNLKQAIQRWGFWAVVGSGISQEQIDHQLAIGNTFFKCSMDEKNQVTYDASEGNYFGYRQPTRYVGQSDVVENMEILNIPKYSSEYKSLPRHEFIKSYEKDIEAFQRLTWDVVRKLFVLFALMLGLPEDYFVQRHSYDLPSEDHLRWMLYHPRVAEQDAKVGDQWLAGHTDFGSLTLLFSQSVTALQIRNSDSEWKWVKHIPGGIICNAGDTFAFLTKGYVKSTIHRVMRPPLDQAGLQRLSLFYFVRPGNNVPMVPAPSPVLLKEGFISKEEYLEAEAEENRSDIVRGYEYVRARVKHVYTAVSAQHAQHGEVAQFRVKNIEIQDYY